MLAFTLYSLSLLAHSVYAASSQWDYPAVRSTEDGRVVSARLETPDLHYWDQSNRIATHYPGAFHFDFALTPDNLTLFLNGQPILPQKNVYTPAPLRAFQIAGPHAAITRHFFATHVHTPMELDYYIDGPDTSSETSIYNTQYNPRLRIDILRANIPSFPGYSTRLSSTLQEQIWIHLEDLHPVPPGTPYASIPLRIKWVTVDRRWRGWDANTTDTYRDLESLPKCRIWSWRCADKSSYPYYQYMYQENFDQYGKKGSMRHFLTKNWGSFEALVGPRVAKVYSIFWMGMSLVLAAYAVFYVVFRGIRKVLRMYRNRVQEVDDWLADEELAGVLRDDGEFEVFMEIANQKGEKDLVDILPQTPAKTEKSLYL